MDDRISNNQELTQALDVLSGMKNALADVIEKLLGAHSSLPTDQLDDKKIISEILLQAYAYRTHVLALITHHEQAGAHDYLSDDDIELVRLIIEFCVEINDHDFEKGIN